MRKALSLAYSSIVYVVFFATFLYLVAFVGDFAIVPRTVDRGGNAPLAAALVIDVALIALFGLQHSLMARQGFKRAWTRIVPAQAERSTYVLLASLALIVLFAFWQSIDTVVWNVTSPAGRGVLWAGFGIGWAIVLLSTFLINHFELFGLQQAYLHARGREAAAHRMREPLFYRYVRHPLYLGFLIAFWSIPRMSLGHLLFAAGMSVYILIAIRYEERDLVALFGSAYESYRRRVGMLVPGLGRAD